MPKIITKDTLGKIISVEGEDDPFEELPPVIRRMQEYNLGHQLNLLVDDINAGLFGESAKTGSFMAYIMDIKTKHPKQ